MSQIAFNSQYRNSFQPRGTRNIVCSLVFSLFLGTADWLSAEGNAPALSSFRAACPTNGTESSPCVADDLGYDVLDGQSNKIIRVSIVTPLSVWVIYEGGKGGRDIPRQELPPQLRTKYPYDPAKIAAYRQAHAERVAQERAAWEEAARQQEQKLLGEIVSLEKQDVEVQQEMNILKHITRGGRIPGNGRLLRLGQLRDRQEQIRMRILTLKRQIEKMHAR